MKAVMLILLALDVVYCQFHFYVEECNGRCGRTEQIGVLDPYATQVLQNYTLSEARKLANKNKSGPRKGSTWSKNKKQGESCGCARVNELQQRVDDLTEIVSSLQLSVLKSTDPKRSDSKNLVMFAKTTESSQTFTDEPNSFEVTKNPKTSKTTRATTTITTKPPTTVRTTKAPKTRPPRTKANLPKTKKVSKASKMLEINIKNCRYNEFGVKSETRVRHNQLAASSWWSDNDMPKYGRLDFLHTTHRLGRWTQKFPWTTEEWIQVDMRGRKLLAGVVTQGDGDQADPSYVTLYRVSHSIDGKTYTYIQDDNGPTVFKGNVDSSNHASNIFKAPVLARFVRINPVQWHGWPVLRFEVIVC